jgi:Tfp pilus assembly protein PilF
MPNDAATHNNFGAALLQLKRYNDAIREFEEAMRLDPSVANARDNLAKARQQASSSGVQPPPQEK